MAISPPSWALMSVSFWATLPLMISSSATPPPTGCWDDVLLDRVHDVAERLVGMLGPVRGPLVVEDAAHQQRVGGGEAGADRGPHLVIEIREVPVVGRLDDAIEGDEEVRLDLAL
jgi:hypothetical protein